MPTLSLDRGFALASAAWLVLVLTGAVAPVVALAGTILVLSLDLVVGLAILIRRKRVAVLLALAQLALFTALHAQLYTHWDRSAYTTDREPTALDWAQFTAAHVLRAADVLDFLNEFGVDLQNVEHAAILPGVLVVVMHLVVDIFLLALAIRWGFALWRKLVKSAPTDDHSHDGWFRRMLGWVPLLGLVACVLIFVRTAQSQGWTQADWWLWPLDAVLRGLDIADAMQVFHWRLHRLPPSYTVAALAVGLRLCLALVLAEWLTVLLAGLRKSFRTFEELCEDLGNRSAHVRQAAALELGRAGSVARPAEPLLIQALRDADKQVRWAAADALGRITPSAETAVPALIQALEDGEAVVQRVAAKSLGRIGPAAQAAYAALLLLSAHPNKDAQTRRVAARALRELGPPTVAAVPALVLTLANYAVQEDGTVTRTILRIGRPALPALIGVLANKNREVRRMAAWLLERIEPAWRQSPTAQAAVPRLIAALADDEYDVRSGAGEALDTLDPTWSAGPAAQAALPGFIAALRDATERVRWRAAHALGRFGREAQAAVPALLRLLEQEKGPDREAIKSILRRIDPDLKVPR